MGRVEPHRECPGTGGGTVAAAARTPSHDSCQHREPDDALHGFPPREVSCSIAGLPGAPVAFTHARKSPISNSPLLFPWESRKCTCAAESGWVGPRSCATTSAVASAPAKFPVTVNGRSIGTEITALFELTSPVHP